MTAFAVLGVLFFWWFCWELGYQIAMACDAKARIDDLLEPLTTELEVVIAHLSKEAA